MTNYHRKTLKTYGENLARRWSKKFNGTKNKIKGLSSKNVLLLLKIAGKI